MWGAGAKPPWTSHTVQHPHSDYILRYMDAYLLKLDMPPVQAHPRPRCQDFPYETPRVEGVHWKQTECTPRLMDLVAR